MLQNLSDKDGKPLLSVIIPIYNGEKFLAEAIHTVQQQNYQPLELIVVDDGSTDRTAQIATQFEPEVRYVYQPNQGPAAARNCGIKLAQGEFLAFLDVDDLWAERILGDFITYLVANPDVEIVQGLIQRQQLKIDELHRDQSAFENVFAPYQFISLGSAIYRKSVFDKVGLFDESLWDNEDTDWFLRAWEHSVSKVVLPQVMLFYRKHDRNITLKQKKLVQFGLVKIYKRHLDRMRDRDKGIPHSTPSISLPTYLGQSPD